MDRFHDPTGFKGPATWELGTYPEGSADLQVGGVSWNEAAAYAAFAGKSLPTIYHWAHASGRGLASRVEEANQVSFWDALILVAAAKGGASTLVSEDLNAGQVIAGVTIENPFAD